MTPTIIIDFHDAEHGRDALALARSLGDLTGARFVGVTSYSRDRYGMLPIAAGAWGLTEGTRSAADLAESLLSDVPGARTRVVGAASRERALHETAEREQADLIVVSSDAGTPNGQAAAGAAGRRALQGAPCAVALAPAGFAQADAALAPVGAGFNGSRESRLALASAAGLADALDSQLRVISVLGPPAAAHPMFAFTSYEHHLE